MISYVLSEKTVSSLSTKKRSRVNREKTLFLSLKKGVPEAVVSLCFGGRVVVAKVVAPGAASVVF